VTSAVAAWQAAEATAWDAYQTALAAIPDAPALAVRVAGPPAAEPFVCCQVGDRLEPVVAVQKERGPLIDWKTAKATGVVLVGTQFGDVRRYTVTIRGGDTIPVYRPLSPSDPPGRRDYNLSRVYTPEAGTLQADLSLSTTQRFRRSFEPVTKKFPLRRPARVISSYGTLPAKRSILPF
jgi:hypothetical protein